MTERNAVVAFVADPDVSHVQWRVVRPLRALARVGIPTEVITIPGPNADGWTWHPSYQTIALDHEVSTLLLHHAIVPPVYRDSFVEWVGRIRESGVTVVYDTDDDTYSHAWAQHHADCGTDGDPARFARESEILAWPLQYVDGVTVSTEHLASVVERYTSRPVAVVLNAIDVEAFSAGLGTESLWWDHLTIGWCAGYRPEADAAPVAEAWRRIAQRYPDVRFIVAGHPLQCLVEAVPTERLGCLAYTTMDRYPAMMQVDIGCCSAADTPFNRSRSPIKAWEFALAGAAVVASPTVYGDWLASVPGGAVARSADEWEHALGRLICDRGLRHAEATALRETVERAHALTANLWRYTDAYRAIAVAGVPT